MKIQLNKDAVRNLLLLVGGVATILFIGQLFQKSKMDNCELQVESSMINIFGYAEIQKVNNHEQNVMQELWTICME